MKTIRWVLSLMVLALCATVSLHISAKAPTLNVYNWSAYIAKDTVPDFEKETGTKVHYDNYDSNDMLQATLLGNNSSHDIVVPTSDYAGKQIASNLLWPLDKSKLPNLKYLDPALMALVAGADPGNQYLVPWTYGTSGLGYNVTEVQRILGKNLRLDNWDILFKPEYLSKLKTCGVSMLDEPGDVFAAALHYIGKAPDSINPADYRAAFDMLKRIRPYIAQFDSSNYINDLVSGDICIAYGWSGDVVIAKHRAVEAKRLYNIEYYVPQGGAPVSFDVMAIPKHASNKDAALQWINYIEKPQVNAAITNAVYYASANAEARKYVDKAIADDPAVYPSPEVLKTLFLVKPLPPDIQRLELQLWADFKSER